MAEPIWWNLVITLSSCNDVILYVQQTYVLSTRRPTQQRKAIDHNSARIIDITSVAIVHLHKQLRESHEVRATNFSYGACGMRQNYPQTVSDKTTTWYYASVDAGKHKTESPSANPLTT